MLRTACQSFQLQSEKGQVAAEPAPVEFTRQRIESTTTSAFVRRLLTLLQALNDVEQQRQCIGKAFTPYLPAQSKQGESEK